jgi:hypothetical protein
MGSQAQVTGTGVGPARRARFAAIFSLVLVTALVAAQPAAATFHEISIREVYPGSAAAPQSGYVEVQMYEAAQTMVAGKGIDLYNATGAQIDANGASTGSTLAFGSSLSGGVSQQTILIGDDGVHAAFPSVTPDLENAAFNVPASGGAACWATSIDCVSWGNFTGSLPSSAGTPADSATGIPDGMAIRRSITGGSCTNRLDVSDDHNDSATDFSNVSPAPVSFATVPSPPACTPPPSPPTTTVDTGPASSTQATNATFTFHSSPAGATFECRVDVEAFAGCTSGISYPGPFSEASHTFQVKATNGNGTGPAASYPWTVDLTPPDTTITQKPVDPSPGGTSSFKYTSTQGSKFECKLSPTEGSFTACNSQPKTYLSLADGDYTFEVRAIDPAGNVDPSPAEYEWEVDNSLADTTPPETTIKTKPADPSSSTTAEFTYQSNEPNSTFQCKMDAESFAACPASGKSYTGLGEGQHTFQVRATDTSSNTDLSPAGYSFSIVLATQLPEIKPPEPTTTPPETIITTKPKSKTQDRTPTFKFKSSVPGAAYECKLDGKSLKPCRSPLTTKPLSFGKHTLKVSAKLPSGLKDGTPAVCSFKVVKPR